MTAQEHEARILELTDQGITPLKIAEELGLERERVSDVLRANLTDPGGVDPLASKVNNLMRHDTAMWEERFARLAEKHFKNAESALDAADNIFNNKDQMKPEEHARALKATRDLAVAAAVGTDKALLLTGRATERAELNINTDSMSFRDAQEMMANALRAEAQRQQAIDVQAVDTLVIEQSTQ